MSLLRIGAAAAALVPLVILGKVRVPRTGRLWVAVVLWGVAWFAAYTIVLNASEALIDAATAAMVVNIAPLIVAVVSGIVFGEGRPPRTHRGSARRIRWDRAHHRRDVDRARIRAGDRAGYRRGAAVRRAASLRRSSCSHISTRRR